MLLNDKTGVILGIANKRSIAWHIAQAADREGARLILTYQSERFRESLAALAETLSRPPILVPCDVTADGDIDRLMATITKECGHLDFLVHAIAYAQREDLAGAFHSTSPAGWDTALRISAFSLVELVDRAAPLMEGRNGSVVTLSYLGSERVIPSYNVMGVAKAALESSVRYLAADMGPKGHRVNAVSAGPIKTLAASGVSGFSGMLGTVAERSPMKRNIEGGEVGDATLFFLSGLSRAVTGQVLYGDCGSNIMGM
jgi:enoyl-[acyl-carrier protein] reductase I